LLWPLAGLAFAGAVLFAAYLAAELMILMLDYVRDVRRIREAAEAGPKREAGSSGDGPV
jgi:shikimate kinase